MRCWFIGLMFAVISVVFWEDVGVRRLHIVLANIWWAAAYISATLERRA
jgi:hypothetical protein